MSVAPIGPSKLGGTWKEPNLHGFIMSNHKRPVSRSLLRSISGIESSNGGGSLSSSHAMRSYGSSMMNRMGDQQVRWKRQVIEQRRNIYDRHSMLN